VRFGVQRWVHSGSSARRLRFVRDSDSDAALCAADRGDDFNGKPRSWKHDVCGAAPAGDCRVTKLFAAISSANLAHRAPRSR